MSRATLFRELLDMPVEAPLGPPKKSAAALKVTAQEATILLWKAVDADDAELFAQALAAGGSYRNRRDKRSVFHETIRRGQWELFQQCLNKGADANDYLPSGETVLTLLSTRDEPADLDRLVAGGYNLHTHLEEAIEELGQINTPRLALRLIEIVGVDVWRKKIKQGHMDMKRGPWYSIALKNPQAQDWSTVLGDRYGKDDRESHHFWTWMVEQDSPALVEQAMRWGWDAPAPWDGKNAAPWGVELLASRAVKLFAWFIRHPTLRQELSQVSSKKHEHYLAKLGPVELDALREAGVALDKPMLDGVSWAHAILSRPQCSKAMVEWWLRRFPEQLTQANAKGKIPLDMLTSSALRAFAEKQLLTAASKHTPAPAGPSRSRMRL